MEGAGRGVEEVEVGEKGVNESGGEGVFWC